MPVYEITDPKTNRTLEFEGAQPPNESVIRAAFAKLGGGKSQPQRTTPAQEMQPYIDSLSGPEKFLTGVGKGMTDIYTGGKQRLAELGAYAGLVSPETVQGIQRQVAQDRELFKPLADQSTAANVGEFVGQVAPTALIPGGVAGGVVRRAATAAGAGALTGALQPTGEGESALTNIALGAATGAGASATMSGIGKAYNAINGNVPNNEVSRLADKYKIPTTLGEETDQPLIQHTETLLEKVPLIGLGGFRKKQQAATEDAAKGFIAKYIIDPNSPDIAATNREYVDSLYRGLTKAVEGISDQRITPSKTKAVSQAILSRYPDVFKKLQDTKLESLVKSISSGVADEAAPTVDNVLLGKNTIAKTLSFDEAWTLRKALGDKIGQARQQVKAGNMDKTELSQLNALFRAVDNDIEKWSASVMQPTHQPRVYQTLKAANEAYRNYVVKYNVIQEALDKAEGIVGAGEMFSPKKFSTSLKKIAYENKALKNFSPQEIEEMTGLANIMQVVKRAGQYAENPPTGARWGIPAIATALASMAGIKTVATAVPVIYLGKTLTGTKAGKNLVRAASRVEPNSPAMKKIVDSLYNMMPKIAATGATND